MFEGLEEATDGLHSGESFVLFSDAETTTDLKVILQVDPDFDILDVADKVVQNSSTTPGFHGAKFCGSYKRKMQMIMETYTPACSSWRTD